MGFRSSGRQELIPLENVLLSRKNRKALKRDRGQIESMRQAIEAGEEMVPIKVIALDDGWFQLVDGRHRFIAAELAGERFIEAEVRGGNQPKFESESSQDLSFLLV